MTKALSTGRAWPGRTIGITTALNDKDNKTKVQLLTFTYDGFGNLTRRYDGTSDLTEDFSYDTLNRLVRSQLSGTGGPHAVKAITDGPLGKKGTDPN